MAQITVIGGGVAGLTCTLELARAGHIVRCVREIPASLTVSRVAGGLWFPYHVEPRERVLEWGIATFRRFAELAEDPFAGVRFVEGLMVHRGEPDLWWTAGIPMVRPAHPEELPDGAVAGTVASVPLIETGAHLAWLERQCWLAGAEVASGRVESLSHAALAGADVVVVAAGLGSSELVDDPELVPGRGQVVRLLDPGLRRWYVDGDDPNALTYILPHGNDVVCGGTDVAGSWDTEPDPEVEADILARCRAAVPELADAPVVGRAVGLRPNAPAVRLERLTIAGRTVITNYGHGGAGLTLAWGCAAEVVSLVERG
ncbi:MAG: FAD-dependent oxidoreductase [Tetrasphaera sp.]